MAPFKWRTSAALAGLFLVTLTAYGQVYGDPDFYLLDAVQPAQIDPADRRLLDSLLTEYHAAPDDTTRLAKLGFIVEVIWDDVWIRYNERLGQEATALLRAPVDTATRRKGWYYRSRYYSNRAYQLQIEGRIDSVADHFRRAIEAAELIRDTTLLGYTLMSLGGFQQDRGDQLAALDTYERSVPLLELRNNQEGLGRVYYALLALHTGFDNRQVAETYGRKAIYHATEAEDLGTVGAAQSILSQLYLRTNDLPAAEREALAAVETVRGQTDLVNAAAVYLRAAVVFDALAKLSRVRAYADTSLVYARAAGSRKEITDGLLILGKLALQEGELDRAEDYLREGLALAEQLDYLKQRRGAHELLALLAERRGQLAIAYSQLKWATALKDSLFNSDVQRAVLAQGVEYRYARQKELDDLANRQRLALAESERHRRTQLLWIALGSLLLVGLVAVYIFSRLRIIRHQKTALDAAYAELERRQRNELAASNLQALQAQMNPHFIFNALNSVQDLVLLKDVQASNRYLGKFSDLLRRILQASRRQYISLREEIEVLHLYLELEQLRFGEEFTYRIESALDEATNETRQLPAMFVQPFAENAMKHGLFHRRGAKHLHIRFVPDGDYLRCTVTDNGVGQARAAELARPDRHGGFSGGAVRERIRLLNQTLDQPLRLEVHDLTAPDGSAAGTEVVIWFPPLTTS